MFRMRSPAGVGTSSGSAWTKRRAAAASNGARIRAGIPLNTVSSTSAWSCTIRVGRAPSRPGKSSTRTRAWPTSPRKHEATRVLDSGGWSPSNPAASISPGRMRLMGSGPGAKQLNKRMSVPASGSPRSASASSESCQVLPSVRRMSESHGTLPLSICTLGSCDSRCRKSAIVTASSS